MLFVRKAIEKIRICNFVAGLDLDKAGAAVLINDTKIRGIWVFASFKFVIVALRLRFKSSDGRGVFEMKAGIEF